MSKLDRRELPDALTHFAYEAEMFFAAPEKYKNATDDFYKNSAVEAFANHMRVIGYFF